jgi:hypothetical protein
MTARPPDGGRSAALPSYIVFRLIVTYFALETLFTVSLKEPRWRLPVPVMLRSSGDRST